MAFRGFPPEAITFFEGLEADNSKSYWTAHKDVYERAVKGPMEALCVDVDEMYRPLKMFRPYRDVRFSADKSPYKTAAAAAGEAEDGAIYYVQLSTEGLLAATGMYQMRSDQLERYRAAVDDERSGAQIATITDDLVKAKFTIGSMDQLKTAPRGYPKDHPRVELLRLKGLTAGRRWPVAKWLYTAQARTRIEEAWRACRPMNDWLGEHVGPSELEPDERDIR